MFHALLELARQSDFTIGARAIGEDKGTLVLVLAPSAKEGQEPALAAPVKLSGTPEELTESFARELGRFTQARGTLVEQVDATVQILNDATKAQAAKAADKLKASTKGKPGAKPAAAAAAAGGATTPAGASVEPPEGDELDGDDESGGPPTTVAPAPSAAPAKTGGEVGNLFG